MRKVDDGEKKKKKRMTFLVATTSLPAVYRPNGYARTTTAGTPHTRAKKTGEKKEKKRKKKKKEKNGVFSGHYVIASSLPPERLRPNDDRWNAACSCQKGEID